MITVVADTHAREGHQLAGRTLEAVREASVVVHAGDFTTEAVLDAFVAETGSLAGVIGNNDDPAVRERLPETRVVQAEGMRLAVVHGHEHTETALSLLGRQSGADLVVFGHSHRPGVHEAGEMTLLNPGSHARPRRYRPAHAELVREAESGEIRGRLVDPDGTVFERFTVKTHP